MSIASEIERIQTAKTNLITDLNNSGFDIPQSTLINNVVTTINDDVLPLIDNRYDTFLSISTGDASVGNPIYVDVQTPEEASGSINFNIGGWFEDSVLIKGGKAMLYVETQLSGSVAPVGENLISVSYDGDSNYKPAMATEVVTISKQHSRIAITQAIVDGDTLVIDYSGGTSDIGVYCESFNIGEFSWQTGCVVIFFEGQPIGIANSDNGRGNFLYDIEDIESGTYQIQVAFLGDNKYELSVSDPVNITIPSHKKTNVVEVETYDIDVGDKLVVSVTCMSDYVGDCYLTVNNVKYSTSVEHGEAVFEISDLPAGAHTAYVELPETASYESASGTSTFNVSKVEPGISIDFDGDPVAQEPFRITVTVPEDYEDDCHLTVNNIEYVSPNMSGKAFFEIPGLHAGTYTVYVELPETAKYVSASSTDTFTVIPA